MLCLNWKCKHTITWAHQHWICRSVTVLPALALGVVSIAIALTAKWIVLARTATSSSMLTAHLYHHLRIIFLCMLLLSTDAWITNNFTLNKSGWIFAIFLTENYKWRSISSVFFLLSLFIHFRKSKNVSDSTKSVHPSWFNRRTGTDKLVAFVFRGYSYVHSYLIRSHLIRFSQQNILMNAFH